MATTTPNYGWTVPTSTDLVKDGATAIETLGDAIDASMNTALGTKKAGMVLLNTTSFSGVSSVSGTSLFSSTYKNYRLVFNCIGSGAGIDLFLRYRSATTDHTGNEYNVHNYYRTGTSGGNQITGVGTSAYIGLAGDLINAFTMDILDPLSSTRKLSISISNGWSDLANRSDWSNAILNNTTSRDGFTILTGSGTITGSYSLYGYNK